MAVTKGKIEITFTRDAVAGEYVEFERVNNDTAQAILTRVTFVDGPRYSAKELPINAPTAIPGESEAIEFERFFNIDFNQAGIMNVSRDEEVITVEIAEGWDFQNYDSDVGATEVITPESGPDLVLVSADLQIHPTDPCDFVDIDIETSPQADEYLLGQLAPDPVPITTNPFTVSIPRVLASRLVVRKDGYDSFINVGLDDPSFGFDKFYFNKIFQENIFIDIVPNQFEGATVTITVDYLTQLFPQPNVNALQYSLDNVVFTSSNVFTGQANGNYTVYIKDSWGCTVQKDYVVTGSGQRDPYFFISDANSVTFSKDEVWDGLQGGIHKHPNNTLALQEVGKKVLYDQRLFFTNQDVIRIQFKSNFENHNVTGQNCAGDLISLVVNVEQMSNNMNLFESLDAKLTNLGNGRSGLYFTSGNVYNESAVDIGNYELNGNLPDSAQLGVFVSITGHGVHEIIDTIYDRDLDKKLMVFDYEFTLADADVIMSAHYDLLPYEVFEFEVDFSNAVIPITEQVMRLRIQSTDALFSEINHYSEYIDLIEPSALNLDEMVLIDYWNENNRDIFYLYGIAHSIRAEVHRIVSIIDDENENVKGDNSTYLTKSVIHDGIEVLFKECTYRMMRKLTLALSSEKMFINGEGYVKNDGLGVTPVEGTNLYNVTAQLLSTNKNFNISTNERIGQDEGYKTIYIPRVLDTSDGLLKL